MKNELRLEIVDRRDFVLGASAILALACWLPSAAEAGAPAAQPAPAAKVPTSDEVIKAIVGDAKPAEGKINLELPEIAENGNTVPFTISVDSPMTDKDYVKALHIVSTGNPRAEIGSYFFTPAAGKAITSSRMRLAKTQDIVAIAEMSDGKFYMGKRNVKVTIGGCGG
jgi:sulfur-oxidizing protein SoxY